MTRSLPSDTKTVRNTVLGTVIGGLILSGILSFLGGGWSIGRWVVGHAELAWSTLTTQVNLPLGLILLLSIVALLGLWPLTRRWIAPGEGTSYEFDRIFNVDWMWRNPPSHQNLTPFCPDCRGELVLAPATYRAAGSVLYCETCEVTQARFVGRHWRDVAARAIREIERRSRIRALECQSDSDAP